MVGVTGGNFWASENLSGRVHFEGYSPEWRVLSKLSVQPWESGYHQMVRVLLKQLTRVSQAGIFCFKIFRVRRPHGEVLLEKLCGGMRPAS